MQSFLSSFASTVLDAAATLVADENDNQIEAATVSPTELEFAEGLSVETFRAFPADRLDSTWIMVPAQEAHAKAILEQSKNVRDIRFKLCPSQLRDEDFWQIYFVVTQKDGVESIDELSLGSSWGLLSEEAHSDGQDHGGDNESPAPSCGCTKPPTV